MLTQLADEIWWTEHAVPMAPGVRLDSRMTVVRLRSGELWLHSPVPIDEELADELAELGPVRHLVAPNLLHHLYMADAKARYPEATAWGAEGLGAKEPDVPLDRELGPEAPASWPDEIGLDRIEGAPKLGELVFFHEASRTLILTDMLFHILEPESWGLRAVLYLAGTHGRLACSRLVKKLVTDRGAFEASIQRVLERWPLERALMAHGEPVVGPEARARVAAALEA